MQTTRIIADSSDFQGLPRVVEIVPDKDEESLQNSDHIWSGFDSTRNLAICRLRSYLTSTSSWDGHCTPATE
jgi:hypothetical protein